jgi:hypothetical protein
LPKGPTVRQPRRLPKVMAVLHREKYTCA